jgi:hypothetical protein
MRSIRTTLVAMMVALVPVVAHASPVAQPSAPMVVTTAAPVALPAPAPKAPLAPLTLLGFALVGATAPKARKMNLSRTYLFNGQSYGPGNDIAVPDDFPEIDGETGDVIFEEGSRAAANQARARSFSTPPNTGGVNTGESQGGGTPASELEGKTKQELMDMAAERGLTVTRGDRQDGDPVKQDYIDALSK